MDFIIFCVIAYWILSLVLKVEVMEVQEMPIMDDGRAKICYRCFYKRVSYFCSTTWTRFVLTYNFVKKIYFIEKLNFFRKNEYENIILQILTKYDKGKLYNKVNMT